ncbi:MAG: gliding motility-associated C-terminal domain-containing protein [Bacteroidetes bacterium]|nr:gliding motility-associated C-terminal domain-containing protein [Bacteroidota bacterium]
MYVPNAFTPNGDGLNDIFQPKGFGIVKYELEVFDRWGEKLFSTTKFEEGWSGTYVKRNSEPVPNDVYVWQIRILNVFGKSKELTGKVTVSR